MENWKIQGLGVKSREFLGGVDKYDILTVFELLI